MCDKDGCAEKGLFPAPKSRNNLDEHYYFCKLHAREYNEKWDFFSGMDQEQVTEYQKSSRSWHRPSWVMASMGYDDMAAKPDILDQMERPRTTSGMTAGCGAFSKQDPRRRAAKNHLSKKTLVHLAILGLDESATMNEIKKAYKMLVKKYHPDKTGGDIKSEEKFKNITAAYQDILKHMDLEQASPRQTSKNG